MPKSLSNPTKLVTFFCTSCEKKYTLVSGHKEDNINIDICGNCHPFFKGTVENELNLGPAEKLKNKFAQGKNYIQKNK